MSPLVWLLIAVTGVCLHAAAMHGLRAFRQREGPHARMALLGLAVAVYVGGFSFSLKAVDAEDFRLALRVGYFGLLASAALLALGVRALAGGRSPLPRILLGLTLLLALAELLWPGSLLQLHEVPIQPLALPWGETVSVLQYTDAPGHWLINALLLTAVLSALRDLHQPSLLPSESLRVARVALWWVLGVVALITLGRAAGLAGMIVALAPAFVLSVVSLAYTIRRHEHREAVTERQRTERQLRQLAAQLALAEWRPPPDVTETSALPDLADTARELLGVERISIWRLEGEDRLRTLLVRDARGSEHEQPLQFDTGQCADYLQRLRNEGLIVAENAFADARLVETSMPYLQAQGVRASLDLAIRSDGRMVGLLCIESVGATRQWSDDDVAFASALTLLVATRWAAVRHQQDEARTRQLAFTDLLTKLPTRIALADAITQRIAECREHGGTAALLIVDVDHFQTINDVLGHDVGDEVLRQMARTLGAGLQPGEFVARIAGDGFALLLPVAPDRSEALLLERTHALRRGFEIPLTAGENRLSLGTSVGVAVFDAATPSANDVLRHAEMALRQAKSTGRGRAALYRPSLEAASTRRLVLHEALRQAESRGELALVVQPKVDRAGRLAGGESLLRWNHPVLGAVAPGEFIPAAESTGLITGIGQWALRETCRLLVRLPDWARARPGFSLAVNLSAWQLARPDIVGEILATVRAENALPSQLTLEITESIALHDLDEVIGKLKALRAAGFRIALDDFGTGYSSLAYLHRLPLDELKIDRSFVVDAMANPAQSLLQPLITLGRHRGLVVVAEGIETAEQAEHLAALGCDLFQGYGFAPPLAGEAFLDWVRARAPMP